MFLSDRDIRAAILMGEIKIDHWDGKLQPASIDLTLADGFKVWHPDMARIDPMLPVAMQLVTSSVPRFRPVRKDEKPFFLLPAGEFCLATTIEKVTIGDQYVGRLEGKSSLGRLGLTSHVTAGFFDPGFSGYPTLELFNASGLPFHLYPGMKIAQMSFAKLLTPAEHPYGHESLGSKYQDQERIPRESEYWKNYQSGG